MTKKFCCLSIDLINYDKPPASLAFMAGVCEAAQVDYIALSLNSILIDGVSKSDYNLVYSALKLDNIANLELYLCNSINRICSEIEQFAANTILVSLFSFMQAPLAKIVLRNIKKRFPSIEIIAGGPGVGYVKDNKTVGKNLLETGLIDFYCLGEGDVLLLDFINGHRDMLGLNSFHTKFETWVPQINDLDKHYIIPSYKKISTNNYKNLENKDSTIFAISTSRGCVRKCSFCDVAHSWPKFRFRSGESVAKEILQHHRNIGAVHFTIVDSLINGSLKSFKAFNAEMIKLKQEIPSLANFSYNGMFIVRDKKTHTEDLFRSMKAAGCESLAIGVETGSDALRFQMNKKFTNEDLDHHLDMCQKVGIQNTFLMFVGYPTETREDFELTLKMLERYQKFLIDGTLIGINHTGVYELLTNTPVYDYKDDIGIVIEHDTTLKKINWSNVNNPDLTVKEQALRDLKFRLKALELRYPIPYARRYLEYLQHLDKNTSLRPD